MGAMATKAIIPLTMGSDTYNSIKDDVVQEMLEVRRREEMLGLRGPRPRARDTEDM